MQITMELYELKNSLIDAGKVAVAHYIKKTTPEQDLVSQRKAYGRYGEMRVKGWAKKGLLTTIRNGISKNSKKLYSVAELEAIDSAERLNPIINQ